ncbi:MAG: hypothetical protein WD063_12480 [Pirellulales bacterium]
MARPFVLSALFVAGICAMAASLLVGQEARQIDDGKIANVVSAFERIPAEGKLFSFERGAIDLPRGGHLQGIQMRFDAAGNRHLAFLSHDSATVAYLAIVEFPADLAREGRIVHVHTFKGDGRSPPLKHAGGIQLLGDLLVVGLEDNQQKTRSEIQFWNVGNPEKPVKLEHLTIRRAGAPEDKTAGAVGIAKREKDYLVAVANWDSRAIDFYTSNGKPLDEENCRFELRVRWRDDLAEKADWRPDELFGEYQAINLVTDAEANVSLVGTHTARERDFTDLFAIDVGREPTRIVRKLASKQMGLDGGNHFRYAGGVWMQNDGLAILSSQRNVDPQTRINVAR